MLCNKPKEKLDTIFAWMVLKTYCQVNIICMAPFTICIVLSSFTENHNVNVSKTLLSSCCIQHIRFFTFCNDKTIKHLKFATEQSENLIKQHLTHIIFCTSHVLNAAVILFYGAVVFNPSCLNKANDLNPQSGNMTTFETRISSDYASEIHRTTKPVFNCQLIWSQSLKWK